MVRVPAALLALFLASPALAQSGPVIPPAAGAPPAGFDRAAAQQQTLELLKQLIAIDTQNPPGNELRVARHFESLLKGTPGVEVHVVESAPGRGNIVARLRAENPTKRPIVVMGHMDTVGADPTKWTSPAFTPTERDGYLYGRGTIDDKGSLAATVVAMQFLAKSRGSLDRDIILLGTAAEESGGAEGVSHVLTKHFDLIKDAEFALNEGGRVRVKNGRIVSVNVQVTEKLSYTVVATARGTSGHGSVPLPDNAIAALSRALSRVHELKLPVQLNPTNREYFKRLATIEPNPDMREAMTTIATATDRAVIDRAAAVLSKDVTYNATLRTGVSLTMINGGIRGNVIPSDATATLNVRVPPGGDIAADLRELNRVGGESQVTFEVRGNARPGPPASSISTPMFHAMETAAKAMAPDAITIPFMSTGATDGAQLRDRGIPTYGILLLPLYEEDELRMHGDNERTPIASVGRATGFIYRSLQLVAAR